jgi:tetratricopeptide (TPR) repeat protein
MLTLLCLPACHDAAARRAPEVERKEAWEDYRIGEFKTALNLFRALRESHPDGSEYNVQGLYGEGTCWNYRRDGRDEGKAIAAYQAVVTLAPKHQLASWSALEIVRARHLNPADDSADPAPLISEYAELYAKYPNTPAGEEAFLFECSLQTPGLDREHATQLLQQVELFLKDRPQTPFRGPLEGIIAECYNKLDMQDKRLELMVRPVAGEGMGVANPNPFNASVYWNIAYVAEFEAGNFALAREYYHRMLREYPRDVRVFAIRAALKRMDAVEAALRAGKDIPPSLAGGAPE